MRNQLSEDWREWPEEAQRVFLRELRQLPTAARSTDPDDPHFTDRERCRTNPAAFVTGYCFAQNLHDEDFENARPSVDLIPDWPHVRALLAAFFPPKDVVIEKSRRMIASWIMMGAVLYDLTFESNWPIMVVSRIEDDVDNGGEHSTTRSLFGKVRFMWERLPDWLRPDLDFKHLSIVNRKTNAFAEGYSSTANAGRGGGYRRAILDEFAWVEHSEQVMASVGQACSWGKVLTSTPQGKGNAFWRVRQAAYSAFPTATPARHPAQFARYTIHWRLHPQRDDSWKQRLIESQAMTEEAIAQELEINYAKARGRRVYPKYSEDQHMASGANCRLSDLEYEANRPIVVACDWNHDPLIWELAQTFAASPTFRVFDELSLRNAVVDDALFEFIYRYGSESAIARLATEHPEWAPQFAVRKMVAGVAGHAAPVIVHGDATEEKSTVHNRTKTYQHVSATLRSFGFTVTVRVPPSNPPIATRIEVHNHALAHGYVVIAPRCEELRKDYEYGVWNKGQTDMDQAREDDDGSGLTRSHASSALGYWLAAVHKVVASTPQSRAQSRSAASFLPRQVTGW